MKKVLPVLLIVFVSLVCSAFTYFWGGTHCDSNNKCCIYDRSEIGSGHTFTFDEPTITYDRNRVCVGETITASVSKVWRRCHNHWSWTEYPYMCFSPQTDWIKDKTDKVTFVATTVGTFNPVYEYKFVQNHNPLPWSRYIFGRQTHDSEYVVEECCPNTDDKCGTYPNCINCSNQSGYSSYFCMANGNVEERWGIYETYGCSAGACSVKSTENLKVEECKCGCVAGECLGVNMYVDVVPGNSEIAESSSAEFSLKCYSDKDKTMEVSCPSGEADWEWSTTLGSISADGPGRAKLTTDDQVDVRTEGTITAKYRGSLECIGDGKGTFYVLGVEPSCAIHIAPDEIVIDQANPISATCASTGGSCPLLAWTSSNTGCATISSTGDATADAMGLVEGTTLITAKGSYCGKDFLCSIDAKVMPSCNTQT